MTKTRKKTNSQSINEISELITFKNSQNENIRGSLLKLSQNYIVFEVYNPYSIVQLSEILQEVKIQRAGSEIYKGKATITNIINTGIILIVSATIYNEGWTDESINNPNSVKIKNEIEYLISDFDSQQKINKDFKANILNIKSFLMDSKNWLNRLEPSLIKSGVKIDNKYVLENFQPIFQKLHKLNEEFSDISENIKNEEFELHKRFAQSQLHPLILIAPFTHRIYTKPLGFAGDYMMIHMIQKDQTKIKLDLYSKFINTYYTSIPIATSVKNRTDNLVKLISEGVKKAEKENREFNSLSIGCGPALEIKRFIKNNNPKIKCNFELLDFNEETLNFAKSEAEKEIKNSNFSISKNLNSVHTMLKNAVNNNIEKKYDLVYCSGLFDYLSDKICAKLTQMFFKMVKNNGTVLVTNMHS